MYMGVNSRPSDGLIQAERSSAASAFWSLREDWVLLGYSCRTC